MGGSRVGKATRHQPGPGTPKATPARRDRAAVPLLALQAAAGNQAVLSIARQPTVPMLPTVDQAALDAARKQVRAALLASIGSGRSGADLVADMRRRVAADPKLAGAGSDFAARTSALAEVKAEAGGGLYDYVTAGIAIRSSVGGDDDLEQTAGKSFAPGVYATLVTEDISFYLGGALGDPNAHDTDVAYLNTRFADVLGELDDRAALLQMELDGTLEHLIELRVTLAGAPDAKARKALHAEVATLGRRALLLNAAAVRVRAEDDARPQPVGAALERVESEVTRIRSASRAEAGTRTALGDGLSLLGEQGFGQAGRFASGAADVRVEPEEVLPKATAAASDRMTATLAKHVEDEASVMGALRARVIPQGRTAADLKAAFDRWHAFVSPGSQPANPLADWALGFYDGVYEVMGHAGIQGGITRGAMMSTYEQLVAAGLPQTNLDFASEVAPTHSTSELRGTAGNVETRIAERYPSKAGGEDFAGEVESREDFATKTAEERRTALGEADRLLRSGAAQNLVKEAAGVGPQDLLVLLPPKQRVAWSYLVRTEDPLSGLRVAEERSMPLEVANLILAENQRLQTLRHTHSTGGLGEKEVRKGGIEAATGTVGSEYLEGQEPAKGAKHPSLEPVDAAREAAEKATAKNVPAGKQATATVLAELEAYLDKWFGDAESVERIVGVLAIANREYGIATDFAAKVEPAKLAWAVTKAVAIAAAMAVAARMGPLGRAFAEAAGALMKLAGAPSWSNILAASGWCFSAGRAGSLSSARAQAYMSKHVVDALVSLIEDGLSNAAIATSAAAWRSLASGPPPTTTGEAIRMLAPVLKEPGMQKAFLEVINREIQAREFAGKRSGTADPDLPALRAAQDTLHGTQSPGAPHPDSVPLDPKAPKPPDVPHTPTHLNAPPGKGLPAQGVTHEAPLRLGKSAHEVKVVRTGDTVTLWLCSSECALLIDRLSDAVSALPATDPRRGDLDAIRAKAVAFESQYQGGKIGEPRLNREVNKLAGELTAASHKHTDIEGLVIFRTFLAGSEEAARIIGETRVAALKKQLGGDEGYVSLVRDVGPKAVEKFADLDGPAIAKLVTDHGRDTTRWLGETLTGAQAHELLSAGLPPAMLDRFRTSRAEARITAEETLAAVHDLGAQTVMDAHTLLGNNLSGKRLKELQHWEMFAGAVDPKLKTMLDTGSGKTVRNLPPLAGRGLAAIEADLAHSGMQGPVVAQDQHIWTHADGSVVRIKVGPAAWTAARTNPHLVREIADRGGAYLPNDIIAKVTESGDLVSAGTSWAKDAMSNWFRSVTGAPPTQRQRDVLMRMWGQAGHVDI